MKKEEFLSFITEALDEIVAEKENEGYQEADFGQSYGEIETGDYPEEEEYYEEELESDVIPTPQEINRRSVFNQQSEPTTRQSAEELSTDFSEDLFSKLIEKFKPSEEVRSQVFSTKQAFESIPEEVNTMSFCGTNVKYTRYEKPLEIPEDVVLNTDGSLEDSLNSYNAVLEYVMTEVEKIYGGRDRITDIAVVSDIIIINRVSFEPLLKDKLINSLPYDLQYAVRNGCFAYLFDFSYLYRYKNLVNFKVDSVDFLYQKVRIDLGKDKDFEPKDMFSVCRKLNTLQVGDYVITRHNVSEHRDVFKTVKRRTEIADKIEEFGWNSTKKTWGCARDIFLDSKSRLVWKTLKLAFVGSVATVTTVGTAGFKLARVAGKAGGAIKKGIKDFADALRENS